MEPRKDRSGPESNKTLRKKLSPKGEEFMRKMLGGEVRGMERRVVCVGGKSCVDIS
jgi:hypothetical protein